MCHVFKYFYFIVEMALDKTSRNFGQIYLQFVEANYYIFLNMTDLIRFFSRPSPKAGRELQAELEEYINQLMDPSQNQPEPVTGP